MNTQLINSLLAHIAVIDKEGTILETNIAWQSFNSKGPGITRPEVGSNYFEVLQQAVEIGNDYALKSILGMKKVLQGDKDSYTLTYPLQTSSNTFWFSLTLRPCNTENTEFVMIHEDVSSSIQSKNKLRETKNRYQIQFEQSPDGILITDLEGNIIDANPAASNILGWSQEELLDSTFNELMDTDDPAYKKNLQKRDKSGSFEIEINLIHRNSTLIPAEVSSQTFRNKNGELRSIFTLRDISQRKKIEQDLLKNKQFTESVLNSNPGIFFVIDQEQNLIPWNDNFVSILGYSSEDLSGKNVLDLVIDEEKSLIKNKIEECIKEGELSVETRILTKEGEIRDYQIQANRFEQDGEIFVVGSGTDITEQKKAERENRETQLLLEQLFENAPVGITILNTDNDITKINESFEKIFNYTQQEAVGKNINELIVPADKEGEAETISNTTLQGQIQQTESVRLTKEGKEVPVLIGGVPVKLQGKIIAIYGIYVDISEQAEYQQKIEQALREKEALLAELHHRVKNNLALIISLLEIQLFDSTSTKLNKQLANIKNRILTIASIHEVLYQNGNLSKIPFNNFFREFISNSNIQNGKHSRTINLAPDTHNVCLQIDQSIPCGLLINELLSLIFESTSKDPGEEVSINLREYGSQVHLILEGKDMVKNPNNLRDSQSLHNFLIDPLLKQLKGTLLWPENKKGNQKFELIFTKTNGNSPAHNLLGKEAV